MFTRKSQKSLTSSSEPFIFVVGFTYDTPTLTANRYVRHAFGDWNFGGVRRYSSGGLIGVPGTRGRLNSYVFQSTRMNRVNGEPLFLRDPGCKCIDPNKDFVLNP